MNHTLKRTYLWIILPLGLAVIGLLAPLSVIDAGPPADSAVAHPASSPSIAILPSFEERRLFGPQDDDTASVATGDLDGDGDLDLIAGNSGRWSTTKQNAVYLNDGTGNFDDARGFGTGTDSSESVVTGDVDGDGDLDLIVGNDEEQNVIYLSDGTGVFYAGPVGCSLPPEGVRCFGTGSDGTRSVAVGDVNGDGALDIVVGNSSSSSGEQNVIYLNNGTGYFYNTSVYTRPFGTGADKTLSVVLGDVNDDGALDIIAGNDDQQGRIYLNDGSGNFSATRDFGPASSATTSVAVGDVDGDGALDIAVGNESPGQSNVIYLNNGASDFYTGTVDCNAPPANAYCFGTGSDETGSIALGDADGDGDLDVVTGNYGIGLNDRQNVIYLNDGEGHFHTGAVDCVAPPAGARCFGTGSDDTRSLALGDVNTDGALDIVTGNFRNFYGLGQNVVYLSDGGGDFSTSRNFGKMEAPPDVNHVASVVMGDVNGDGHLDLVVGNDIGFGDGQNMIYLNDGTSHFYAGPVISCATLPDNARCLGPGMDETEGIAVGDLDGDGDLDIITGNEGQQNVVYLNDGTAGFADTHNFGTGADSTMSVAVGDMNGDGPLDIIIGNRNEPGTIYFNDGNANFHTGTVDCSHPPQGVRCFDTGSADIRSLAVEDLNGDGALDIVTGNWNEPNQVYLNHANGDFFTAHNFGTGSDSTESVAIGDVDGDGALDIIVGNYGQNMLFLNDGAGQFYAGSVNCATPPADVRCFGSGGDYTRGVAVGDVNGDGALDIVAGNWGELNVVYLNDGTGQFDWDTPAREFDRGYNWLWTGSVATGDINGDGTLDVAFGTLGELNMLFLNRTRMPERMANNPPYLSVTRPVTTENAGFHASPVILDSQFIPVTVTLFDNEGDTAGRIEASYSLDGGGYWLPAAAATDTITSHLSLGAALSFDGVNDWVETSDFDINDDFTLSLWVNPAITMTAQAFIGKHSATGSNLLLFGYYFDSYYVSLRNTVYYSVPATTGWQHLAVVGEQNGATTDITVYRDGEVLWQHNIAQLVGDVSGGWAWTIGQDWDSTTQTDFLKGRMDEVRIWNVALTQAEIRADRYHRLQGDEPGLVAYWPFDEGTGNITFDQTANGYDGMLGGTVPAQRPKWVGGPFATYVYYWDVFASGFFGQSDNVVFRLEAYPQPAQYSSTGDYRYLNSAAGPYQWPYASATTFPFRVRGTQVQVLSSTTPVSNALVYRLPEGQDVGGLPFADGAGIPFRTDGQGYLQGRGQISPGDRLLALLPVSTVLNYAGALTFDGQDDYAIKDVLNHAPITETTVSFWISATQTTNGTPFSYAVAGEDNELTVANVNNLTFCRGTCVSTGITVTDGVWHHIAVTWRSADGWINLYKDGAAVYTDTLVPGTTIVPGGSLVLGQDQDSVGGDFEASQALLGLLDDVHVWNVALTENQIQDAMFDLIEATRDSLVASWSFDDPDNPGVDASGNANDLTLYGTTWDGDYLGGYTVYHTNGTPTEDGVNAFTVQGPGVQVLTVAAEHPLILFDLNLSLEWDAHNDPLYLQQLETDLKKASAYLYDFTDGQVALGHISVHQNADYWASSHIAVQASNHLRPFAHIGGIRTDVLTETVTIGAQEHTLTYGPGQIRMGATWNRYGDPAQSVGVDWPLILAHELSHYLLYQYDVYIGLDENGMLTPQDTCTGSAMGDVYDPDNTEFISDTLHWSAVCSQTLAAQTLGRTEWATLLTHYPWLITPTTANDGPSRMAFDFATVEIFSPGQASETLEDPTFYLDYEGGAVSSTEARAFLLRDAEDTPDPAPDDFEYIYDLGNPIGGQNRVVARGARPGDRLCVFDRAHAQFGCEIIAAGDERLALKEDTTWTPIIQVSPVNTTTFTVQVSGLTSTTLPLRARLYPEFGTAFTPTALTYVAAMDAYSGTLALTYPSLVGHVQVWVDESATELAPRRETIVGYAIGGNPGPSRVGGIGPSRVGGIGPSRVGGIGPSRVGGIGPSRVGGIGMLQAGEAPVVSPDGQMILYLSDAITLNEGQFYTIQAMAGLPALPPGRTLVGPGYNLVATGFLTDTSALTGSVSIQYLGNDVLIAGVDENDLVIYFWDGLDWTGLDTVLNTTYNMASASGQGTGIYALMASIRLPLTGPGWNLISYPVRTTQTVTQALLSISGYYTTVYGYEADDPNHDPWKVYDVTVPEWVNDLAVLEFGKGYWINVSQAISLYLSSGMAAQSQSEIANLQSTLPLPPATFYGKIYNAEGWAPADGMPVTAWIDGHLCGQAQTQLMEDQVVYAINVVATDGNGVCGVEGKTVVFQIGERWMAQRVTWNTTRLWEVVLSPAHHIYLPVILKTTSLRNEYQITVPIQTESGYKKHRQWESCLAFSP